MLKYLATFTVEFLFWFPCLAMTLLNLALERYVKMNNYYIDARIFSVILYIK